MELPSEFVEAFDPLAIAENGKHKSLPEPVSEYDRLQALFRKQEFIDDLNGIRKARKKALLNKFYEKYEIHPDDVEFLLNHFTFSPKIKGLFPLSEELSEGNVKGLCNDILNASYGVTLLDEMTASYHFKAIPLGAYPISQGKYVAVRVDLSQKKSKILSDFENCLDQYVRSGIVKNSYFFNETRGKNKEFQESIWRVYDLCCQKKKPNFTGVAQKMTGITKQATEDEQLAACLKYVRRAYKRASEIVKSVEIELEKKKTPESFF